MQAEHVRDRLHKAVHGAPKTLSNKDLEEVLVVAAAAVLAAELALVTHGTRRRVEALKKRSATAWAEATLVIDGGVVRRLSD